MNILALVLLSVRASLNPSGKKDLDVEKNHDVEKDLDVENDHEVDSHIFLLLDLKRVQEEDNYTQYKNYMSYAKSMARIAVKNGVLLQMLTINKVTNNFVSILQIIKDEILLVDDILSYTKALLTGLCRVIAETRNDLPKEISNEKYLLPENFPELENLVNATYEKNYSLQQESFNLYKERIIYLIKEANVEQEKAKMLIENLDLLEEGLFIMYKAIQEKEIRLYREIIIKE
ncbi:hypothetical protein NGRA_0149 [Nosema granulosis]|uniref:Uncharacterized protein n=1 Tax=Nosema granulosis TaxID=83296 RepID=A0A9P6H1W2_9MICR|nr:hypothetical protein NGRA_0149 [Nosema granulosis]